MSNSVDEYQQAQRAVADLKSAILRFLIKQSTTGATNAEVGKGLGIYFGHKGHVGHVSRAVLALLEDEGLVRQDGETKRWFAV